jgi:Flp pilus assembly protein TadG
MAIVAPILFLLVGGIIQFGLIFWSEQTLTQIARDTGRWAATQTSCSDRAAVASTANTIAGNSSLFGYGSNWAASASDTSSPSEVVVDWHTISGSCPPADNQEVSYVSITIDHQIPLFFPLVPGDGRLSTTAEFRMEPLPS